MKFNQQKSDFINNLLDEFYNKDGTRRYDESVFSEIFAELEKDNFEQAYPEHYFYEVKRVRDLYCTALPAIREYQKGFKKGYKEGLEQAKIEKAFRVAKEMKTDGVAITTIAEVTGLTEVEIADL